MNLVSPPENIRFSPRGIRNRRSSSLFEFGNFAGIHVPWQQLFPITIGLAAGGFIKTVPQVIGDIDPIQPCRLDHAVIER